MDIVKLYHHFLQSSGVTTDSRHCPQGSLFFALKGPSFDGNLYADKALASGCVLAVVDDASVVKDERYFLVDDVLTALQLLANYHRRQFSIPVIGITGSNGKTTTKELLATVLETSFNLHYTQGNFNNHIGVPLTLLLLKPAHEMAIIEMGANHPLEIGELCRIAEPNFGVITNIGKAHLEGFGGIEGVIKTKKELYDFIRLHGGTVFVNGEDELLVSLSEGIERVLYNDAHSRFRVAVNAVLPTLRLEVYHNDQCSLLTSHLVGEYNTINIAVALELGGFFGLPTEMMVQSLEAYVPSNNRSQIMKTAHNQIVLDAYNANPASMAVAVANFDKIVASSKVVILGAMKELGDYSKEEHQDLVNAVSKGAFKRVMVVGLEFEVVDDKPQNVAFFNTIDMVKQSLKSNPIQGSTVLLKGSRSMKMETLVDLL